MSLDPAIPLKDPKAAPGRKGVRRAVAVIVNLAVFGAALVGVRTLVVHAWPWEPDGEAGDKLAAYSLSVGSYDTVVVGSSRIFRQVSPVSFDGRLCELGWATRTFNFGLPGMTAIEMRDYLRRVLDVGRGDLRWVIIAPEFLDGTLRDGQVGSLRVIAWHGTTNTLLALRSIAVAHRPLATKADFAYNHLAVYATNMSGNGEYLAAVSVEPDPVDPASVGLQGDGWLSLDDWLSIADAEEQQALQGRQRRLAGLGMEGFAAIVERMTRAAEAAARREGQLDPVEEGYLAGLVAMVRAAGAEPMFLVAPGGTTYNSGWLVEAEREGVIPVLFDFGNPRRYPDLFAYGSWFDDAHLGKVASERFSRYLADEVAAYLAGPPGPAG
jgi:hypothetical protein